MRHFREAGGGGKLDENWMANVPQVFDLQTMCKDISRTQRCCKVGPPLHSLTDTVLDDTYVQPFGMDNFGRPFMNWQIVQALGCD